MDDGKSNRGRKRKVEDVNLSQEDQLKKQKNRDAAKKCREKKEREAQQLKSRNDELETENQQLMKERQELEEKVKRFKVIIEDHQRKGCRLPPNIEAALHQESLFGDNEDFREVGTIEYTGTPPHTPDSSCSEKHSPATPRLFLDQHSHAPTALFSGNPLPQDEKKRRHSSSSSRSSSRSPAPAPKDLSQLLMGSKAVPPALAPIAHRKLSTSSTNQYENVQRVTHSPAQLVPTVVLDDDETDQMEEDKGSNGSYINDQSKLIWVPITEEKVFRTDFSGISTNALASVALAKAFEQPDITSEDNLSREIYTRSSGMDQSVKTKSPSENLPSLGFNIAPVPEGYSYTEDLQGVEPPGTAEYTPPEQYSYTSQQVPLTVCARAILSAGNEMAPSLQEQIKSSCSGQSFTVDHRTQAHNSAQQKVLVSHQVSGQSRQQTITGRQGEALPSNLMKSTASSITRLVMAEPVGRQMSQQNIHSLQNIQSQQKIVNLQNIQGQQNTQSQLNIQSQPVSTWNNTAVVVGQSNVSTLQKYQVVRQNSNTNKDPVLVVRQNSNTNKEPVLVMRQNSNRETVQLIQQNSNNKDQIIFIHEGNTYIADTANRDSASSNQVLFHVTTSMAPTTSSGTTEESFSKNVENLPSLNFTDLNTEGNIFEKKPSSKRVSS
ncbi:uncharacterized protein LOC131933288 [Physella acuta]|uniref:uncharacterized protein LOC131933288 n=1 Tax=Physella acuta TaxID=109671 RepID=UPI0027DC9277|nr:uncharacterized protein LOC131933288 [Physella acuta]